MLIFMLRISTRVRAMTNSGRMKYSLTSFIWTAVIYLASAVIYVLIQLSVGLYFDTESVCMTYMDSHKVAYFFTNILSFFFGFAVPYGAVLYYVNSITSTVHAVRPRTQLANRSINAPLLHASFVDPVSQMLMNMHQQTVFSSADPSASVFEPNPAYDPNESESTISSNSSFSFLQPEDSVSPAPSSKPFFKSDADFESSDDQGFFDDSDYSDSFFASRQSQSSFGHS